MEIRDGAESFWKQVLVAKYGVSRYGWDSQGSSYLNSDVWRGILTVKEAFAKSIRYHVGSGEKIFFWLDTWIGDRPLVD